MKKVGVNMQNLNPFQYQSHSCAISLREINLYHSFYWNLTLLLIPLLILMDYCFFSELLLKWWQCLLIQFDIFIHLKQEILWNHLLWQMKGVHQVILTKYWFINELVASIHFESRVCFYESFQNFDPYFYCRIF